MLRLSLLPYWVGSILLLGCRQESKSPAHTLPGPHVPGAARARGGRATAPPAPTARHQTLYPDTLRPRAVAYQVWPAAAVDTMQGHWLPVTDARYRVLDVHGTPAYGDGPYLRLFCRASVTAATWRELDLRQLLGEFQTDLYLEPQTVELDQRPPTELLLRLGGRNDGNSSGTGLGYTLLVALTDTPTICWQSVDSCAYTSRPLLTAADTTDDNAFTNGYSEEEVHRRVTVKGGLVLVSSSSQEAPGGLSEASLTPITPGYYRYRAGRFQRVASKAADSHTKAKSR